MIRWLLAGMLLGGLIYGSAVGAQSLPRYLFNGRTTGGVNVPLQVLSDGTVVLQ